MQLVGHLDVAAAAAFAVPSGADELAADRLPVVTPAAPPEPQGKVQHAEPRFPPATAAFDANRAAEADQFLQGIGKSAHHAGT